MARITAVVALALAASVNGFAPTTFGVRQSTSLNLSAAEVRSTIAGISKDNFDDSLKTLEPALLESGSSIYRKSMKRIARKAKEVGAAVPEGYALEAKATLKKRTKQNEFIQAKEAERIAAEEEAAAAAAEAEPEAEAEAPAEE